MFFRQIYDPKLAQYSYVFGCQRTGEAIVIDPMRDVQPYFDLAKKERFRIVAAADTHIHADYLTGLREFAERGVNVYASDEGAPEWRYQWLVGSDYHYQLLTHDNTFSIGSVGFRVLHTPGHTPEHLCYLVTDHGSGFNEPLGILTGDFVFVGDVGRPDLLESAAGIKNMMKPMAHQLYRSLLEFKKLPEFLQVWPAHGAGSACGKTLGAVPHSTIGYELRFNPSLRHGTEQEFIRYILDGQPEPPLYFARMKRVNRAGPPVLETLPQPKRITAHELSRLVNNTDVALIDTRSRVDFMAGHVPGSLLSPWTNQFNTIAGCCVEENTPIYLIIAEENVETAVRDLVNVGLDTIVGYATPETFKDYAAAGGPLASIRRLTLPTDGEKLLNNHRCILDVRRRDEFEEIHLAGEGVRLIPHTRLLERMRELPLHEQIYVHCRTGSRSAAAAALLKRHGYDVVYVDGELIPWLEQLKVTVGAS